MDLLGSGTAGVQPFAVWSGALRPGVASPERGVPVERARSVLVGQPRHGRSRQTSPIRSATRPGRTSSRTRADAGVRRARALRLRCGASQLDSVPRARQQVDVPQHRIHEGFVQRPEWRGRDEGHAVDGRLLVRRTCSSRSGRSRGPRQGDAADRSRVQLLIRDRSAMTINDCHCHFLSDRFFESLGREKFHGARQRERERGCGRTRGGTARHQRSARRAVDSGARPSSRVACRRSSRAWPAMKTRWRRRCGGIPVASSASSR